MLNPYKDPLLRFTAIRCEFCTEAMRQGGVSLNCTECQNRSIWNPYTLEYERMLFLQYIMIKGL